MDEETEARRGRTEWSQGGPGPWQPPIAQRASPGILTVPGRRSPSASASHLRSLGSWTSVREGHLQENRVGEGEKEGPLGQNQPLLPRPKLLSGSPSPLPPPACHCGERGRKDGDEMKGEKREEREQVRGETGHVLSTCIASCEAPISPILQMSKPRPRK